MAGLIAIAVLTAPSLEVRGSAGLRFDVENDRKHNDRSLVIRSHCLDHEPPELQPPNICTDGTKDLPMPLLRIRSIIPTRPVGVLLTIVISLIATRTQLSAADKVLPNVIVIMADDLGYGDVSCYGATALKTPNIDRLASEGQRFTSGYCSASTCTPTRYSFLTGSYAFRTPGTGIAPPNSPALIQPGTPTIASLLKQAGYRTAVVGKWHLGTGRRCARLEW